MYEIPHFPKIDVTNLGILKCKCDLRIVGKPIAALFVGPVAVISQMLPLSRCQFSKRRMYELKPLFDGAKIVVWSGFPNVFADKPQCCSRDKGANIVEDQTDDRGFLPGGEHHAD